MLLAAEGSPCELGGATAKLEVSSNWDYKSAYTEGVVADLGESGGKVSIINSSSLVWLLFHEEIFKQLLIFPNVLRYRNPLLDYSLESFEVKASSLLVICLGQFCHHWIYVLLDKISKLGLVASLLGFLLAPDSLW